MSDQFDNHKNIYPTHLFSAFLESGRAFKCSMFWDRSAAFFLRHWKENNWGKRIQNRSIKRKQLKKNYSEQIFLAQMLKKLNAQSRNSEYFSAAAYIFTSCNQIPMAANNVSLKTCCIQLTHFSSTAWRYFPRYNIWYYIEIKYYRKEYRILLVSCHFADLLNLHQG